MGVIVETADQPRTFLMAVQKVLLDTGDPDPGTLAGAPRRVQRAMEGVRDALEEVWYATEWNWRINFFRIEPVRNRMWYDLPDDFGGMVVPISIYGNDTPLQAVSYEKLLSEYPQIRAYPEDANVSNLATIVQLGLLTDYFGVPTQFCVVGDNIGLFKIPDADFVADSSPVIPAYYRGSPDLSGDSDQLSIPRSLYRAHHKLATGYFKQYAEMSDYKQDLAIGRDMLQNEVLRQRRRSGNPTEFGMRGRDR